jgi:AcrR family transcriptional regulator
MPRWPEDSRHRLVGAALELFTQHGYAAVTVDDIASRAGLSSRTFFRYFPDKEEVLFADDDDLLPALLASIVDCDSTARTAEHDMARALATLAALLEPRREPLGHRQRIIDSQVSLSGRELSKQARWQQKVMEALITRGYAPEEADLLSAIGFAVFRRALHAWLADPAGPDLGARLRTALPRARTVLDAGAD